MWETIGSIIIKYWVEFLLGLIAAGVMFFGRRYIKLRKDEQQREEEELKETLKASIKEEISEVIASSKEGDERLQQEIDVMNQGMNALKAGVLSMQGKQFIAECDKLLEVGHVITLEEWEELFKDHEVYNGLGGNHNGDMKFGLVEQKFKSNLVK